MPHHPYNATWMVRSVHQSLGSRTALSSHHHPDFLRLPSGVIRPPDDRHCGNAGTRAREPNQHLGLKLLRRHGWQRRRPYCIHLNVATKACRRYLVARPALGPKRVFGSFELVPGAGVCDRSRGRYILALGYPCDNYGVWYSRISTAIFFSKTCGVWSCWDVASKKRSPVVDEV